MVMTFELFRAHLGDHPIDILFLSPTVEELTAEPLEAAHDEPAALDAFGELCGTGGALAAHTTAPAEEEDEDDEGASESHEEDLPPGEAGTGRRSSRRRRDGSRGRLDRRVIDEWSSDEGGEAGTETWDDARTALALGCGTAAALEDQAVTGTCETLVGTGTGTRRACAVARLAATGGGVEVLRLAARRHATTAATGGG